MFGLIILLTIFGLLAGLCKGLIKTTVKTVLKAILITVFVFTTPLIAKGIGNIDISSFEQSITVNNQAIKVTTIMDTLANIITATGIVSPMNGIALYETSFAVAYSVLSYVIFLVLMILTQILISLLTCIVYNVFVRWLVPKKETREEKTFRKQNKTLFILINGLIGVNKKTKKHRLSGAILGAVQEFVFACILLMPITSISRIAISNTKSKDSSNTATKNAKQETTYNNYGTLYQALLSSGVIKDEDRPSGDTSSTFYKSDWDSYIGQIENSLVYKMLGVGGMDSKVMDKVSVTTVNGQNIPLSDLVTGTLDVAYPLLETKAIQFDTATTTITINYSTLLATTTVDTTLQKFVSNKVIMSLLPPLIDTALNYASASTNIPFSSLDFSDVDWSTDITAIKDIYTKIYDAGIKPMVSNNTFDVTKFCLSTSSYSDEQIQEIADAISSLASVNAVKNNLGLLFSNLSLLLKNTGFDVLPSEISAYDKVEWSKDLSNLVTDVLKLFRLCNLDLSYDLFNTNQNFQSSDNKITLAVKDVLKDSDKRNQLNTLLTGDNGIFTISLLDAGKLGNLVNSSIQMIPSLVSYTKSTSYTDAIESLNKDSSELRKETDIAFRLMDILFDKDKPLNYWDIKELSKNSKDKDLVLSYLNKDVCDELVEILDIANSSQVFKSMYGSIIKTFVFEFYDSTTGKEKDYLFGLTPYDFNFHDEDFINDLKSVINLAPELKTLYENLNDKSLTKVQQLEAIDTSTLRPFLNILANSELLNSEKVAASTGETTYNSNVEKVLTKLFSMNPFNSLKISVPDLSNIKKDNSADYYWGDGTKHNDGEKVNGEIDALCSVIEDLQTNKALIQDLSDNRNNLNKSTLKLLLKDISTSNERCALFDLVSDAYQSKIIKPTAVEYTLKMADKFLTKYNIPYSLSELRTYVYNDDNNEKIVEDIQNLKDLVPLLNTIDSHKLLQDYRDIKSKKAVDKYYFQTIPLDTINAIATAIVTTNTYQVLSDSDTTDNVLDSKNDLLCNLFYSLCKKYNVFSKNKVTIPDFSAQVLNPNTYGENWVSTTSKSSLTVVDKNDDGTQTTRVQDYELADDGAIMRALQAFYLVQNTDLSSLLNKHMPKYRPSNFLDSDGTEDKYKNAKALVSDVYIRNIAYIYGPYILEDAINYVSKIPTEARSLINYINWDLLTSVKADGSFEFSAEDALSEIKIYTKMLKDVKKLGIRNLKNIAKNVNKLTSSQLSYIQDLLSLVPQSKLLTTIRPGYELSLISKGISVGMTYVMNHYPKYKAVIRLITLDDDYNTNLKTLEGMLSKIDESNLWTSEFNLYSQMLGSIQGVDIKDRKNLYAEGRNYDTLSLLTSYVNKSELLHKAPIGAMKIGINKMNFNEYIKYSLDLNHHLTTSDEDVAYWQEVYNTALECVYKDDGFKNFVKDDISNLKNFKLDTISTSFLYYLGKIDFLQSNRSYALYKAMVKAAGEENLSKLIRKATNTPKGEDSLQYQFENLFFQNAKLYKNGELDKELAINDTKCIDAVLNQAIDKLSKVQDATQIKDIYNSLKNEDGSFTFFSDLTANTMYINAKGEVVRSDFASELVAGIITTMLNNDSLAKDFAELKKLDFYANDYELVNPIEGKAIDTLITFLTFSRTEVSNVTYNTDIHIKETTGVYEGYAYTVTARDVNADVNLTSWSYYTKGQVAEFLSGLCYSDTNYLNEKTKTIAKYFKSTDTYKVTGNSVLAKTLASITRHEDERTYTYTYNYTVSVLGVEKVIPVPVTGSVGPFDKEYLGIIPLYTSDNKAKFLEDYIGTFTTQIDAKSFMDLYTEHLSTEEGIL